VRHLAVHEEDPESGEYGPELTRIDLQPGELLTSGVHQIRVSGRGA
jgi:hypothetical protein